MRDGEGNRAHGWFFLHPDAVPESWRGRARPVMMVPLLPEEAAKVLLNGPKPVPPALDAAEEELLRLVAGGLTAAAAAGQLGLSTRAVEKRLQRLRERLGVRTTGELIAMAARGGF